MFFETIRNIKIVRKLVLFPFIALKSFKIRLRSIDKWKVEI